MPVLPLRSSPFLQEVLELGDEASTDSGWGGSASSSAEEKSSGRERGGDSDDDDGDRRSTSSSGGGGSGAGRKDASPVVSGPELAVFLFQGGVQSESDCALEAKDDSNPSAVARGRAAQQSPCSPPPSEDALFEYSGSGGERSSGNARGCLRTGELGGSSAVGKAATRESGDPTAMSGGDADAAAIDVGDFSERREAGVDAGTKSASLTGELRGVDFVRVPANTPPRPRAAAGEPTSCFF